MTRTLEEQIKWGKELIARCKTIGKNTNVLEDKVEELEERLKSDLLNMRLSEIETRNIALQVYSQILGESVWFCSNETMVERVKCDTPGVVCYTMDETREIVRLEPVPEDLKAIHKVKRVFPGSKIKENLKERRLDIHGKTSVALDRLSVR